MNTINIANARKKLFELVLDVNVGYNPIMIINNKGKNAVLLSEDEWKNIEETLYLSKVPSLKGNIKMIRNNENWNADKKFDKNEKW